MPWISLCKLDELRDGIGKYIAIGGRQLAVFLHEGKPYVLDNRCPHAGGSLSGGDIQEGCIVCPWHGWAFDLQTGRLGGVEHVRIGVYPSRLCQADGKATMVEAELPVSAAQAPSP